LPPEKKKEKRGWQNTNSRLTYRPLGQQDQTSLGGVYRSSQSQSPNGVLVSPQAERSNVWGNLQQSPHLGASTIPVFQRSVTTSQPIPLCPTSAPPPLQQSDDLSDLFHSKDLRNKRRDSTAGDLYLDLNTEIATRIAQGEKISPVFEEGGNYVSAPYVLVERQDLYPNFHRFNVDRPIPKEKEAAIQRVYDLEGSLPGFVNKCIPAQVRQQANQYTIIEKRRLIISN
jgi:hypothetical protein